MNEWRYTPTPPIRPHGADGGIFISSPGEIEENGTQDRRCLGRESNWGFRNTNERDHLSRVLQEAEWDKSLW
jgi:hypothetical protein